MIQLGEALAALRRADVEFLCVDLKTLIRLKRAAGRPKDLEAIAELEVLLEESRRRSGP